MPRVKPVTSRDDLPSEYHAFFERLLEGRQGEFSGPQSILLHSPEVSQRATNLSNFLRFESKVLGARERELATIAVAREKDCLYVWGAHAGAARKAGVSDALVDALRERRTLPAMGADEAAVVNYAREFFQTHKVSQQTFQTALDQFGAQHLTELTALMGHYAQTAFFLNAFEVQLPEQRTEPVLPV